MSVGTGDRVAPFELRCTRGIVTVPDPGGRKTVLMFFQEAGTPVCSAQVRALGDEHALLAELGAAAVCVSTDEPEQQDAFSATLGPGGPVLGSDPGGAIARRFGVYDEAARRANRAAFVIDHDGAVLLATPWYNPSNSRQFAAIFAALGLDDGECTRNDDG